MSRAIRMQQRYLRDQNRLYGRHFEAMPENLWPNMNPCPVGVLRSDRFLAQIFAEENGATRISVMRTMIDEDGNWLQGITGEDLMFIKNDVGFATYWAVEIFPAVDELVNVANMRHLWVLPSAPAFAWRKTEAR